MNKDINSIEDIDLASVQEVRRLVANALLAQMQFEKLSQEETDKIVSSVAKVCRANAEALGRLASETTGFGNAKDKTIKNILASEILENDMRGLKTRGILSEDKTKRIIEVAVPFGVIAGIIPTTNPTSTTIFKAIIALKAGNAIVFSPHPNALVCILETVNIIRSELKRLKLNEDLVSCISMPTMDATNTLMKHKNISLILATGGSAMVKSAYSSGKPALGVGPGNVPAYIERSANIAKSVADIFCSKTFDNGTICASEQAIITEKNIEQKVRDECIKQGGYFLSEREASLVASVLLNKNGGFNPKIVGQDAKSISKLAGIEVPANTRLLIANANGVGREHPFSMEKLTCIIAFYSVENIESAKKLASDILQYGGMGHTCVIHSNDENAILNFSMAMPVSRMLVNTPSSQGAVGFSTSLLPSLTLGCGSYGANATGDNIGAVHLFNKKRIAYGVKDISKVEYVSNDLKSSNKTTEESFVQEVYSEVLSLLNKYDM